MVPRSVAAVLLASAVPIAFAFAPSATHQAPASNRASRQVLHSGSIDDVDNDDFDPFLLSPNSFGDNTSNDDNSSFGFDVMGTATSSPSVATISDPESPPPLELVDLNDDEFDPLLSPHAYANGVDASPAIAAGEENATTTEPTTQKIGILLIDHGSKRQASNEHIMNVAKMYETILSEKKADASTSTTTTIVRASHMEIAPPSIITSLRNLLTNDQVEKVVCVPYFLSPGRHATEDVPQLIKEAREILDEEGLLENGEDMIVVSEALGSHLEGMLGVVDDLVERALEGE